MHRQYTKRPTETCATSIATSSQNTTYGTTTYDHSYCYKDVVESGLGCFETYQDGGNVASWTYRLHLKCSNSNSNSCSSQEAVDLTTDYSQCYGNRTEYGDCSNYSSSYCGNGSNPNLATRTNKQYYSGYISYSPTWNRGSCTSCTCTVNTTQRSSEGCTIPQYKIRRYCRKGAWGSWSSCGTSPSAPSC